MCRGNALEAKGGLRSGWAKNWETNYVAYARGEKALHEL